MQSHARNGSAAVLSLVPKILPRFFAQQAWALDTPPPGFDPEGVSRKVSYSCRMR